MTSTAELDLKPAKSLDNVEWCVRGLERRIGRDDTFLVLALLVAMTTGLIAFGIYLPWLSPALGGLCVLGIPTYLLCGSGIIPARSPGERIAVCAVLTLFGLMVGGLAANTVLPPLGIANPLSALPAIFIFDVAILALGMWARRRHPAGYAIRMPVLTGADRAVIVLGGVVLVLAIVGAVRLNNGGGGGVTLLMLVLAVVESALLLGWRDRLNPGVVSLAIYGLSLALLLMTSLRGWYTTGHDVQREYQVFELTKSHGHWSMASLKDAYNACLSITILPTLISQWTRVDDPYVYKVFFQLLFALCPVLLFNLAKRLVPLVVALLATLYFVSFVTFFQDMPMLTRQEVAFLFLVVALLVVFNDQLAVRSRQRWFCFFATGMVLSHYSTTYVALGVFFLSWFVGKAAPRILATARRVVPGLAARASAAVDHAGAERRILAIGPLLVVAVVAAVWAGPVTHTQSGLTGTVSSAIEGMSGDKPASKSGDTSYSIVSGSGATPAQRLAEYKAASVASTAQGRAIGDYYPDELVSRYPTPVVADADLPLTPAGRAISNVGIDVAALNHLVRQASARILQLLAVVGLVVVLFARRRPIRLPPEYVLLAIASIMVVFLQVVLPVLSVDYGLLRAFQQSLLVLDILLVAGSLALVPRWASRWRNGTASILVLVLLASSTGVFTQLLGGYGPQLHLNNAGTYYDIYYLHPEEIAGIAWLRNSTGARTQPEVKSVIQTDRFTFLRLQTLIPVQVLNDIYPTVIRQNAYVFLGFSTVRTGRSTVSSSGDLTTYRYPMALLDDKKDLIYSSGGSRVYR